MANLTTGKNGSAGNSRMAVNRHVSYSVLKGMIHRIQSGNQVLIASNWIELNEIISSEQKDELYKMLLCRCKLIQD